MISRGEIWRADLGMPRGSAPALRRPVLILSADQYNRSRLRTVTVAVVTSTTQLAALPGNVPIPADLGVLPTDSVINVTQIATIDRQTLEERIGALPDWLLAQLDAGVQRALGLPRDWLDRYAPLTALRDVALTPSVQRAANAPARAVLRRTPSARRPTNPPGAADANGPVGRT